MKNKQLLMFLGLLIALTLFVGSVQAKGAYDAVVIATGDDAVTCERPDLPGVFVTQDVCNVQAAVDANPGGKILLKGTFHFAEYGTDGYIIAGTDGTVFIANDSELYGKRSGQQYRTTIKGGFQPFSIGIEPMAWSPDISSLDEALLTSATAVPVQSTIQDIYFENALYTPINIIATTGATIRGNRIVGGRSLNGGFLHG